MFDDLSNITSNYYIPIQNLSIDSLYLAATSSDSGPLGRPVAMVSFALNYYFGEGFNDTYPFKLTNLVIHSISAFLIFFLFNSQTSFARASRSTVEAKYQPDFLYFARSLPYMADTSNTGEPCPLYRAENDYTIRFVFDTWPGVLFVRARNIRGKSAARPVSPSGHTTGYVRAGDIEQGKCSPDGAIDNPDRFLFFSEFGLLEMA
jgi:hypothetical protein